MLRIIRLTRDRAAEAVLRDQILRRDRGQGNNHFPCSADHEQVIGNRLIRTLLLYKVWDDNTYMQYIHSFTCYTYIYTINEP